MSFMYIFMLILTSFRKIVIYMNIVHIRERYENKEWHFEKES
jgi:hypothetical protein